MNAYSINTWGLALFGIFIIFMVIIAMMLRPLTRAQKITHPDTKYTDEDVEPFNYDVPPPTSLPPILKQTANSEEEDVTA